MPTVVFSLREWTGDITSPLDNIARLHEPIVRQSELDVRLLSSLNLLRHCRLLSRGDMGVGKPTVNKHCLEYLREYHGLLVMVYRSTGLWIDTRIWQRNMPLGGSAKRFSVVTPCFAEQPSRDIP